MDWVEIVKIATPVVASVVQVLFGTKWWFSRSAKQANLFNRFTKEIAVRDALLKLKVSASESNSPEQISAKASGFKQAGEIEERFNKGLADLIRTPALESPWWRQASTREMFWPKWYEGKEIALPAKRTWWWRIMGFYIFLIIYVASMLSFFFLTTKVWVNKADGVSLMIVLIFVAISSLSLSRFFRRAAHTAAQ